jgi:hypothetical protein
VIAHDVAVLMVEDEPALKAYDDSLIAEYVKVYGEQWLEWRCKNIADGAWGGTYRVDVHRLFVKC